MFINYDVNHGLTVNAFCRPDALLGNIGDVAEAYENEGPNTSAVIDADAIDLLTDSNPGIRASTETLDMLHDMITRD